MQLHLSFVNLCYKFCELYNQISKVYKNLSVNERNLVIVQIAGKVAQ